MQKLGILNNFLKINSMPSQYPAVEGHGVYYLYYDRSKIMFGGSFFSHRKEIFANL